MSLTLLGNIFLFVLWSYGAFVVATRLGFLH